MGKSLKGKELGKGISQRKDGVYQARFMNRFGKRQTIYAGTYTDITKKLRTAMYMDEKQINVVNSTMTLDEWYDSWIKVCKTHCRDTTKRTYAIQYNRLREELGWRKLSQLNLVVLQDAFNQLATDTMREDCKSLLVDMLNRAVETELLNKNIAFGINTIIDNEEKEEKRILSNEEIDILLKTCQYVQPKYGVLDHFISQMTGITNDQIKYAPMLEEAVLHLLEWIGNRECKVFAWSNTDYRQLKHEIQSKGITNPEILEFINQDRWTDYQIVHSDHVIGSESEPLKTSLGELFSGLDIKFA